MSKKDTQVVIAGAGPVGSFAAYYLASAGISVILLESEATCLEDMRASTFHPPTLEMMDEIGIAEHLIERGLKAPIYQYRNRQSGEYFAFDLSELENDTRFPFRLQCEQFKLATLLTDRLTEHPNADMRFRQRAIGFDQYDTHVDVHIETPYAVETVRADFLIGADGANSIIRKWLNVGFDGFTYPEKFLTLSTTSPIEDHFENLSLVNYVADPDEWVVLLRVPSVWRVLVPAKGKSDDELTSDENKTQIFDRLIGNGADVETNHRTIYNVHQRVAERFHQDRVCLIGDAAHLNNPLGGFGMNSGIHDAHRLGGAIIEALTQNKDYKRLFGAYDEERRAIAHRFVQMQTIRSKKMMEANTQEAQKAYTEELRSIQNDDKRRREFLLNQSMINNVRLAPEAA